jgi:hypothetical protein
MSEFINTIEVLGDDAVIDSIIERTITEFKDNMLTEVGQCAFFGCAALETVDLPNVTKVNQYAFQNCDALKNVNLPKCTSLNAQAFQYSGIEEANFPNVTVFGSSVFAQCKSLKIANFPAATEIASNLFNNCSALETVHSPLATFVRSNAFDHCTSLAKLDLPLVSRINSGAFAYCSALVALILRSSTVCTLDAVAILSTCPIADGTGYVYVPSTLVNSYKAATNWSSYANQIRAIEDYPDITGG